MSLAVPRGHYQGPEKQLPLGHAADGPGSSRPVPVRQSLRRTLVSSLESDTGYSPAQHPQVTWLHVYGVEFPSF